MLAAIVPVKQLRAAKQRLKGFLLPHARRRLCLAMLFDVLDNLDNTSSIDRIFVVTPDIYIKTQVQNHYSRIQTILEPGYGDLNKALRHAIRCLKEYDITRVMIIPGDLPLITTDEIENLSHPARKTAMSISSDKTGHGTNLLLLNLPSIIEPRFGPDSYSKHVKQAEREGVAYNVLSIPNFLWDIDCPEDVDFLMRHGRGTRAYKEIRTLRFDIDASEAAEACDLNVNC
jgi:2-phospho-L-lactate/phosphoenolpyruvate guanylyltransferase